MSLIIKSCTYGFRLSGPAGRPNRVSIAGTKQVISDTHYTRVDDGKKMFYLANHHNAACHFVHLEDCAGRITGEETFNHFDNQLHPDNSPLPEEFSPAKEQTLQMMKQGVINCANYVSALSCNYPAMSFVFLYSDVLYPGHKNPGGPSDYGGKQFDTVYGLSQKTSPLTAGSIASIDLDLLNKYHPWFMQAGYKLLDQIVMQIRDCKLIMAFTSPGFMVGKNLANEGAQYLVDHLFQS